MTNAVTRLWNLEKASSVPIKHARHSAGASKNAAKKNGVMHANAVGPNATVRRNAAQSTLPVRSVTKCRN